MWNPLRSPHNPDGLPDTLPFTLAEEQRTGAVIQAPQAEVSTALAHAYTLGSMITGQMDETGIGRRYADDFLDFMGVTPDASPLAGRRVLEIGCGNGYLLHRLSQQGARVTGLEPGEHGQTRFNLPIIRDFFPSSQITGPFDVIVLFGVLEHVERPVDFMRQVFDQLDRSGEVFLGVPDCAPYLDAGDLSCLLHEHWSYFDHASLSSTLALSGGGSILVRASRFGGLLHARVRHSPARAAQRQHAPRAPGSRLRAYRQRAEAAIHRMAAYMSLGLGESTGVYVPGRIINTLHAGGISPGECRFFDDNPHLHGTFFPGVPIAVESRAELVMRPTHRLLIASRSFGDAIADALRPMLPAQTGITTWHDIFDDQSPGAT